MTDAYKKLKNILEELFQLDQADLDFGIYRIMNQKRKEITEFLDKDLLSQISKTLEESSGQDQQALAKELDQKEATLREMGIDPDTNEKVLELRAQLTSPEAKQAMENEVYSHLTNFFRRYYKDGDFISQRRYKEDVYAIPYEGEEVKLYWANHDQYYVKTSEYFKDFRFTLPKGRKVHFKLRDASTDKDNNKTQNNLERRFQLAGADIFEVENDELNIFFTYEPVKKTLKQDKLMDDAFAILKNELPQEWLLELLLPKPTEKNRDRTLLQKYLKDYTARNTFDYFIHKDLGKFLNRELDFYIKNEVLHLDDINLDSEADYKQQLRMVKALKGVARKLITFLAQLEDFQKKLWLKKKFVLQSEYCITLDRIDESFYADIAANEKQREEWITLFDIDELANYSHPLTADFLKAHRFLQVDTQFFPREWKYKLLATIDHLDEQTDGLLINSENFQALKLLNSKYEDKIDTVYIDPPYNTTENGFLYKNQYKHSSWISMIGQSSAEARKLIAVDGIFTSAIDDMEHKNLHLLLNNIFDIENWIGTLVVEIKPSGRTNDNFLATSHEYYEFYKKDFDSNVLINFFPLSSDRLKEYKDSKKHGLHKWRDFLRTGGFSTPQERPNSFYPIYYNEDQNIISLEELEDSVEILPIDSKGNERVWRKTPPSFLTHLQQDEIRLVQRKDGSYKVEIIDKIKEGTRPKSVWTGSKYDAASWGTKLLYKIFGHDKFSFPKSISATQDVVFIATKEDSILLDYFAGSATTAHAVINLNREDNGHRKYILVEMGEYFNSVTKPRVQKVAYSNDWKNGKPVGREGISHCFKYLRLESYEDTLNNLELQRTEQQTDLLQEPGMKEAYLLHYMLDVESRGSLLHTGVFRKPFGYTIKTTEHNEQKETPVDLVETFNYLIGLEVESVQLIRGYVVVTGTTNLENEKTLVIWRDLDEHDNASLNEFFDKMQFSTRDSEFDRIYVNGDNNLQNLKGEEQQWKVSLIEEEFHKRMFDVQEL